MSNKQENKDNQTKLCTKCQTTKQLEEFYGVKRSHCIECERKEARTRMRVYNDTMRGKASQALQASRKAIKKLYIEVYNDLTLYDVLFAFAMADGECQYCGNPTGDYQLEHIVPLSKGGANTLSNITVACPACNRSKNSKNVLSWHAMNDKISSDNMLAVIERMALRKGVSMC
ncbi:HNH endonuclease [Bacillus clarus]|uniref:HNH endonuclease n=1 Tax=Bacillus clarus TaxID=2338372 RepID=A0A090YR32_9BACI|nr:HNH endonuclease [Bacillus clarus]KFN01299.1 HNH endonuclease family protein [Bacillus clarus]RFT67196.1 HNH endonuclease [Bacillus clarus]